MAFPEFRRVPYTRFFNPFVAVAQQLLHVLVHAIPATEHWSRSNVIVLQIISIFFKWPHAEHMNTTKIFLRVVMAHRSPSTIHFANRATEIRL